MNIGTCMDKILQQGLKINIFMFSRFFKGLGLLEILWKLKEQSNPNGYDNYL